MHFLRNVASDANTQDGVTILDIIDLSIPAIAVLISLWALRSSQKADKARHEAEGKLLKLQAETRDMQEREQERLTENAQILLDAYVSKNHSIVLTNSSDDAAHDVSVVVRTEHGRGHTRLAEPLTRDNPAKVTLRDLFNAHIAYERPAMNAEESARHIQVDVYFKSPMGNTFHQRTKVLMHFSSGTYGIFHTDPDGERLLPLQGRRYELTDGSANDPT
ncbi:hypothetical protein [Nesterenkonia rhizosphaerae]|uniref:Uncharacterized protein n=1 Tax=Nesterenkonia rhizosphaerae TaxID=1348272 RepID=A0ABP9FYV9_9MICC